MVTFKFGNLICERWILGPLEVNTYLVYDKNVENALLIDPADESPELLSHIRELNLNKILIFLTHGHADHILGVNFFRKKIPARVMISAEDAPMLADPHLNLSSYLGEDLAVEPAENIATEGQKIEIGSFSGELIKIPGHTPGGMILVFPGAIFSGDTLFAGSVGRSDFPGGDGRALVDGIKTRILSLSDRQVFPGHGPETTISEEKQNNPFFRTFFSF